MKNTLDTSSLAKHMVKNDNKKALYELPENASIFLSFFQLRAAKPFLN